MLLLLFPLDFFDPMLAEFDIHMQKRHVILQRWNLLLVIINLLLYKLYINNRILKCFRACITILNDPVNSPSSHTDRRNSFNCWYTLVERQGCYRRLIVGIVADFVNLYIPTIIATSGRCRLILIPFQDCRGIFHADRCFNNIVDFSMSYRLLNDISRGFVSQ